MKYLILRRLTQLAILALFIVCNAYGFKILQGDLSSSTLLGAINLSDPFAILQTFLASFMANSVATIGAALVLVFYALIAPRAFCGWVCPVEILTDAGAWLRKRLKITKTIINISANFRYYVMALALVFSAVFGIAAWESVSFVGAFARSVIYLSFSAISIAVIVILFEAFMGKRLICGHICPLGAFYAIISRFSLIRVRYNDAKCTHCGNCKAVCPEERALFVVGKNSGFVNSECISCGRCVEACNDDALSFSIFKFGEKQ